MNKKKIFILLGHPDRSGMCGSLADTYEQAAREAGHEVQRLNIGEMQFDPILHLGYRAIQQLEPDLNKFQEFLKWSDHFVIMHPVWWLGMPALLKGLFDRAWIPGSEFRYIKTKAGKRTIFWHRLMKGKTARHYHHERHSALDRATISRQRKFTAQMGDPVVRRFFSPIVWLGPAENVPELKCTAWCDKVREMGRRAI